MESSKENKAKEAALSSLPWKMYLKLSSETVLTFYLATFCIGLFFIHRGANWVLQGIFISFLYAFIIIAIATRLIQKLSAPALMLVIPIAPLLALITVVSLIPLLQLLQ